MPTAMISQEAEMARADLRESDTSSDRPMGQLGGPARYGSDIVADTMRTLGIAYAAITPGSSFRGLHDSLVNYLGNEKPGMLLCLHEEHTVAIAHGYAKVAGRPMAAIVHSNVGLMHATMPLYNAWCDRAPVLLLNATGPVDAMKRRPWIDWIHTSRDQGALVRPYTKWDDQPASPGAAREALLRAHWLANTAPKAPVYINLDVTLQEEPAAPFQLPPAGRYAPGVKAGPTQEHVSELVQLGRQARNVLLLIGRVGRSEEAWRQRIALAEHLDAAVLVDHQMATGFPTEHPLNKGAVIFSPSDSHARLVREADLVLSLDWVDLAGLVHLSNENRAPRAKIVHVSLDHNLHNGWSMDHCAFPPVDLLIPAEPDLLVHALCAVLGACDASRTFQDRSIAPWRFNDPGQPPRCGDMVNALRVALGERATSLLSTTIAWDEDWWPLHHPLDWIGGSGGGGIGAGPGIAVGAALALRGKGRLPVALLGDGDFLMGATALWTAVRYRIPVLVVVGNNRSFYNDELHQERVALARNRPPENKWIGQRLDEPAIDLAAMARSQGAIGIGPVQTTGDLPKAFSEAIAAVEHGATVVVDVRVLPGYG
jgi:acetolactate synthase I/II/III large subunit